jgi:hypothetical protein
VLARQALLGCMPPVLFALVIFQVGSGIFAQDQPQIMILLPTASYILPPRDKCHQTQLID